MNYQKIKKSIWDNQVLFFLYSFACGIIFTLGFPNVFFRGFFPLAYIGVFLYFFIFNLNFSPKKNILSLLLFMLGYNLTGFYWISQTVETFGQVPWIISRLAGAAFTLIIKPQWFLVFAVVFTVHKFGREIWEKISLPIQLLLFATLFLLAGIYTPQLFPVNLGDSLLPLHHWLGMAPILGAHFYHFLSYLTILTILSLVQQKKVPFTFSFMISFVWLFSFVISFFSIHRLEKTEETLNLRIVQANVGNFMKIDSELGSVKSMTEVSRRYYELSIQEPKEPLDLIIWPETALPDALNSDDLRDGFPPPSLISSIQQQMQTEMLIGGYDEGSLNFSTNSNFSEYNSAFHFDKSGHLHGVYHKHQLLPFGETLPFGTLNTTIHPYTPGVSLFSQGHELRDFRLKNKFGFITPICYEILDPFFIRDYLNAYFLKHRENPSFILNLSNDSWYGDTAQPWQHLFLASWRMLEFQIPMIRSTNTGISTYVNRFGQMEEFLKVDEYNVLDKKIFVEKNQPTLYQEYGLMPLYLFVLLLFYLFRPRQKKSSF